MIVDIFNDPNFWNANGCFVCDDAAESALMIKVQLQPLRYETVVVGPERTGTPIVAAVLGFLFGVFAWWAVQAVTEKTEQVLVQEAAWIEFPVYVCQRCASEENLESRLSHKLAYHPLFLEIKEDYPSACIVQMGHPYAS